MTASAKITKEMHTDNNNVFAGIRCFKGTFSLQVTKGIKPNHASCPQELFKKELECLQQKHV